MALDGDPEIMSFVDVGGDSQARSKFTPLRGHAAEDKDVAAAAVVALEDDAVTERALRMQHHFLMLGRSKKGQTTLARNRKRRTRERTRWWTR